MKKNSQVYPDSIVGYLGLQFTFEWNKSQQKFNNGWIPNMTTW